MDQSAKDLRGGWVLLVGAGLMLMLPVRAAQADDDRDRASAIVAASPLHPTVARGGQIYIQVAMGGVPMEGARPRLSGIAYDPTGRMIRLRRKPLADDWSQHLAFPVSSHGALGTWTVYATIERESQAWGIPATVEVVP